MTADSSHSDLLDMATPARPFVQSDNSHAAAQDGSQAHYVTSTSWRSLLRSTLRKTDARETLSLLLFLLDSLAFLHACRSIQDDHTGDSQNNADFKEAVTHFYTYIHALYLPSPHAYSTILPPTATIAPFRIQLDSLPSLTNSGGESGSSLPPTDIVLSITLASKQALQRISELTQDNPIGQPTNDLLFSRSSNTDSMQDVRHATTSRDLPGGVEKRDSNTSNVDFGTLPEPNKLLQATLRRALAETQSSRAPTPSSPMRPSMKKGSELPIDVGVQRWALSCLLHHYLGEDFGQIKQDDGVTSYARDERDDLAIREFFPDPRRLSVVDAELSPSTQSIESMGHAQEAGMSALLDSSKRDDKLKWLLGEFVPTHTVRRRTPLPPASASAGASRRNGRSQRMVARSPTAYQPRRSFPADQGWLSDAEIEEVIHLRRSSSTRMGPPLSPPHRRAWSADSDMANILKTDEASSLGYAKSPSQAYPHTRESFDTTSTSARDWNGGASLSRIDSYDTYDSQSHLIAHRNRLSEASDSRSSHKAQVDTVKDSSPKHSPKQAAGAEFLDFARSSRPFMNLSSARPSVDSVQSVTAFASTDVLSPTTNDLSAQDKQNLVKKSKKLVAILGEAPRKEQQSGQVPRLGGGVQVQQYHERRTESLTNATFRLHYSGAQTSKDDFMAYPQMVGSSSTSLNQQEQQGTRLSRSLSVGSSSYSGGMRRDSNRSCHVEVSQLSPIAASFVSDDGSATSPIAIIQRPAWTEADIAREARRRKFMKIQAFLGERVPASAISDVAGKATIPPASGRTRLPIFTKASHKLQRRLTKSKHTGGSLSDREAESRKSSNRNLRTEMYHEGSHSMDERSRSNSQTSDSNAEDNRPWTSAQKSENRLMPTISAGPQDPALGEIGKAAEPVILAVRRARKLEKVFGSLPPAQLYARSNRWVSRPDERYASDNMSIISRTSKTSIHRARIASLCYIAESGDPELVQDFARVVLSEESDASDIENAGEALEAFGNSNVSRKREVLSSRLDSASIEDDSDEDDGDHSEYMSTKADKTFTISSKSHESGNIDTAPAGRMSIDTESSQLSHGKLPNDLQARLALFGSSPGSPPTSLDLMHQRFDRSKSRKGRDSVLSGATAHSNAGSAYAVDAFGRPQRSHSRTSHTTSTGAGTPRSSMDSVRIQFRRAHKLATVFGTTRGEVFNRVLDDIEADIAEADDEEMDEEEKKEIIESVTALRASL